MKRVPRIAAAALLALALGACAAQDRPEGVVEDWLVSLNQGAAGEPDRYAPTGLSDRILPAAADCDPGALDVVEVGGGEVQGSTAAVPYRVVRAADLDPICGDDTPGDGEELRGIAFLGRDREGWTVVGLDPPRADLLVPSEGGERIGAASPLAWAVGGVAGLLLALASAGLMAAYGRHPTAAEGALQDQAPTGPEAP